jgi:hypothetical protein
MHPMLSTNLRVGNFRRRSKRSDVRFGSKAALTAPKSNFRFAPESGLKSDVAPCPKSAKSRLMHRNKKGDLSDHLSAHACAGSFGQPRLPKALNQ